MGVAVPTQDLWYLPDADGLLIIGDPQAFDNEFGNGFGVVMHFLAIPASPNENLISLTGLHRRLSRWQSEVFFLPLSFSWASYLLWSGLVFPNFTLHSLNLRVKNCFMGCQSFQNLFLQRQDQQIKIHIP